MRSREKGGAGKVEDGRYIKTGGEKVKGERKGTGYWMRQVRVSYDAGEEEGKA